MFLEILQNLKENTCARVSFFSKVACNFFRQRDSSTGVSCEFCKISKNMFFTEHLWAAASDCIEYTFRIYILLHSKKQYFRHFLLVFKIVESLLFILNVVKKNGGSRCSETPNLIIGAILTTSSEEMHWGRDCQNFSLKIHSPQVPAYQGNLRIYWVHILDRGVFRILPNIYDEKLFCEDRHQIKPVSAWCPLKGHTYLKYVWLFSGHQTLKG